MTIEIQNQHAGAVLYSGVAENIVSRSGLIASVERIGAGRYLVTLTEEVTRAELVPHVFGWSGVAQIIGQASWVAATQVAVSTDLQDGTPTDVLWSLHLDVFPVEG